MMVVLEVLGDLVVLLDQGVQYHPIEKPYDSYNMHVCFIPTRCPVLPPRPGTPGGPGGPYKAE